MMHNEIIVWACGIGLASCLQIIGAPTKLIRHAIVLSLAGMAASKVYAIVCISCLYFHNIYLFNYVGLNRLLEEPEYYGSLDWYNYGWVAAVLAVLMYAGNKALIYAYKYYTTESKS